MIFFSILINYLANYKMLTCLEYLFHFDLFHKYYLILELLPDVFECVHVCVFLMNTFLSFVMTTLYPALAV